jgi:hypothetical protein
MYQTQMGLEHLGYRTEKVREQSHRQTGKNLPRAQHPFQTELVMGQLCFQKVKVKPHRYFRTEKRSGHLRKERATGQQHFQREQAPDPSYRRTATVQRWRNRAQKEPQHSRMVKNQVQHRHRRKETEMALLCRRAKNLMKASKEKPQKDL